MEGERREGERGEGRGEVVPIHKRKIKFGPARRENAQTNKKKP